MVLQNLNLHVDGPEAFDVRQFSLEDGLSSLFYVDAVVTSENPAIDLDELVGKPASFSIALDPARYPLNDPRAPTPASFVGDPAASLRADRAVDVPGDDLAAAVAAEPTHQLPGVPAEDRSRGGGRPRCRTCSCSAPTTLPSALDQPSGCAAWSTACWKTSRSNPVSCRYSTCPAWPVSRCAQATSARASSSHSSSSSTEAASGTRRTGATGRWRPSSSRRTASSSTWPRTPRPARPRSAACRSSPRLPLDGLRGHRLEADDFDRLAVSDPTRDLLRWMGIGDGLRKTEGEARWKAFCGVCNSDFKFDPDKKSPADAANALVEGSGKWANV